MVRNINNKNNHDYQKVLVAQKVTEREMVGVWIHKVKSSHHCKYINNKRWEILLKLKLEDTSSQDKMTINFGYKIEINLVKWTKEVNFENKWINNIKILHPRSA